MPTCPVRGLAKGRAGQPSAAGRSGDLDSDNHDERTDDRVTQIPFMNAALNKGGEDNSVAAVAIRAAGATGSRFGIVGSVPTTVADIPTSWYAAPMTSYPMPPVPVRLVMAGTELFRQRGFTATTVDAICQEAGVTKGAFFHYHASKEALAEVCLREWDRGIVEMESAALQSAAADPIVRLTTILDLHIRLFETPNLFKSCLVGTTVQEVSETHPELRDVANAGFAAVERRMEALLADAARARRKKLDVSGLAKLWVAAMQGSMILWKASREDDVVSNTLRHVRGYILSML